MGKDDSNLVIPGAYTPTPIPSFVLMSPEAATYWPSFTSGRKPGEWLPVELLTVAKICELECDIARWREKIQQDGETYYSPKGELKAHPLLAQINNAVRTQLALLRPLSMMMAPQEANAGNPAKRRAAAVEGIRQSEGASYLEIN